jgi:multidrug efflux pump subunit AcrA (membrane-fusion protein)
VWPIVVIVLLLVMLVVGSVVRARRDKGEAVRVATAAQKAIVHRVLAQGRVRVRDQVDVGSEVAGRVATVDVELGDVVNKGDLLFSLDGEQLKSAVDQLSAAMSAAQAMLSRAELGVAEATRALDRDVALLKKGVLAQDAIKLGESRLALAQADVAQAKANVERSRVDFGRSKDALRRARVLAPQAGTVVSVTVEPGQIVTAATGLSASPDAGLGMGIGGTGMAPVVIADLRELIVKLDVDELDVGEVKVGQKTVVTAQGIRDHAFEGVVERVGLMGRDAMGAVLFAVEVRIDKTVLPAKSTAVVPAQGLPAPQQLLRPGMSASADIEVELLEQAIAIPLTSVLEASGTNTEDGNDVDRVFRVVGTDGAQLRVERVELRLGPADGDFVAVLGGLALGDRVVEGPYRVLRALVADDPVVITTNKDDKPKDAAKPGRGR